MSDWIVDFVRELGAVGIGLLMFAENVFPPIPSEIIMPLAGYLSTRGELGFWPAVLAGSVGSLAGASVWYWIGRSVEPDRLRRRLARGGVWLGLYEEDVDRASRWFNGRGQSSVLFGRLLPMVRTLISVPAGFARMPLILFIGLSALGTTAWTIALAYGGRVLGQRFEQLDQLIGPATWIITGALVVAYLVRVYRRTRSPR